MSLSGFIHKWLYDFNIYEDPLEGVFRFSFVDKYIAPYSTFGTLPKHVDELIFFFLFYTAVFKLSEILAPKILKSKFYGMKPKDQIYFHVHVVSQVQCLAILAFIFPMFNDPVLVKDKMFGYTPYGGFIASAASGYFLWDTLNALTYVKEFGISFVIHGFISLIVSFVAYTPFIMYYAPNFLLFEASTPFLNVRWFDLKIPGFFNDQLIFVNNLCLMFTFFFVRICWGYFQIYNLAWDFYLVKDDPRFPVVSASLILIGNLVLDVLNLYWFSLMARIAVQTIAKLFKGEKNLQIDEDTLKKTN